MRVLCGFVLVVMAVGGAGRRALREHHDAIFVARCDARCFEHKVNKHQCVRRCMTAATSGGGNGGALGPKAGVCPVPVADVFAGACLDACSTDAQCPDVQKCCRHQCGVTCQAAVGLDRAVGLPPIPTDLTITERRRGRALLLRWRPGLPGPPDLSSPESPVLYVVEERHHIGRHYAESRLGAWTARLRAPRTAVLLKHAAVRPGRWYQFRVAAVNENGTRGFSEPSARFIMSLGPRPPAAPPNMTMGPLNYFNGTLWGELRWEAPPSDLPIQRYKVFWSRRLHGAIALNSVLVQQQTVPKDQTKFELKNLQANSLYFLQVQALAQFGKERLKGEKSALVLNTTNYNNVTVGSAEIASRDVGKYVKGNGKIEGLHVQRVYWSKDGLLARVSWNPQKYPAKYTVSWTRGPCQNSKDVSAHFQLAATTKSSHLDLHNLEFRCRYRISVREITPERAKSSQDSSTSFTTPSCAHVAAKSVKDKPNCSHIV